MTHWSLLWDAALIYFGCSIAKFRGEKVRVVCISVLLSWVIFTKSVKLLPHLLRYPADGLLLPVSWLYGYFHSIFIKVYAMLTLDAVSTLILVDRGWNVRQTQHPVM